MLRVTILIVSREGGDIVLFPRWTEARRRHAANVAKTKAEGLTEGFTEGWRKGFTEGWREGFTEGRNAMQQEWTAWNARRLHAEANGEPFNEPPPLAI